MIDVLGADTGVVTAVALVLGLMALAISFAAVFVVIRSSGDKRLGRGGSSGLPPTRYTDLLRVIANADPSLGFVLVDGEVTPVFVTDTAKRLLGWSDDEQVARVVGDLLRVQPPLPRDVPRSSPSSRAVGEPVETVRTATDGSRRRITYTVREAHLKGVKGGLLLTLRDVTQERAEANQLQSSEELHRRLIESSPDGIVVSDPYGYIVMANAQAADIYGFAHPGAMQGRRWTVLVVAEDRSRQHEHIRQVQKGEDPGSVEYTAARQDGTRFPVEMRTRLLKGDNGQDDRIVHICADVSEKRRAEERHRLGERRAGIQDAVRLALAQAVTVGEAAANLTRALCETPEWDVALVWMVPPAGTVMHCLATWHKSDVEATRLEQVSCSLSLEPGDDVPGRVWAQGSSLFVPDIIRESNSSRILMASQAQLQSVLAVPVLVEGSVCGVLELFSRGTLRENQEIMQAIMSAGRQLGQFVERKEAEQALAYQARHDALTSLPNRVLLQERLERALAAARSQGTSCALFLMDLDRFKDVNDTLGHRYGDVLLQQVSARLQSALRERDSVARLGGDEFAVLLPGMDRSGAEIIAQRVLHEVEQPYWLEGHHVDIGGSIGIAVAPWHGETGASLLQHADVAMYVAKREKVGYAVYEADLDDHSAERLRLMAELREAITQGSLSVHYQPTLNLRSGRVESVEALVRWEHSRRGAIPPREFIPLAERSGMIKQLGLFVLDTALGQCSRWQSAGMSLHVAVNLSAAHVHDPQVVSVVSQLLLDHKLQPASLILEITESALMVDAARSMKSLTELHDLGVRLAIDDFGTGYSSLAYLTQLPVDEIKIDRCFVTGMASQSEDAVITRTVIDLAHDLGLDVIAEGVESEAACRMLVSMGCDQVQGHYVGLPLPAHQLSTELARPEFLDEGASRLKLLSQ